MLKGSSGPPGGQSLTEMDVKTLLLVLLWAGVTVSTLVDLQKRIIGGRDCGPNERLFHVELISDDGTDEIGCGGSLISNEWILTAAHCWIDDPTWNMTAYLGGHPDHDNRVEMTVTEHHIYTNPRNTLQTHDIMLLKLPNPTQSPHIALPDCNNPPNIGDTVEIAGYGSTTMGADNERDFYRAAVLQCANITIVDRKELRECLRRNNRELYAAMLYQHWKSYERAGVDPSPGDSGGGVVFNSSLYGVHSFTGNVTHACIEAAGFLDVCGYIDWIYDTTRIPRPAP